MSDLTGPVIEPQTSRTDGDVHNHHAERLHLSRLEIEEVWVK